MRRVISGVLAIAVAGSAGPPGAWAVTVPASNLPEAAAALTAATGIQILWQGAGYTGRTRPVQEAATADAALDAMLAGTGLTWRRRSVTTVEIVAAPQVTNTEAITLAQAPAVRTGLGGASGIELPPVDVTGARSRAGMGSSPPAFPGGQIGTGGSVGILGSRSIFDTPFSTTNYTSQRVQDRQATSVGDILVDNPAVQRNSPPGGTRDEYFIRGFLAFTNSITSIDGLFGLTPDTFTVPDPYERIELLRGPSALINGNPTGLVGGTVNLVSKRAPDSPLADGTLDYLLPGRVGGHLDAARRFGTDNAFGARLNAVVQDGRTSVDNNRQHIGLASLGLDYRGDRFRASVDLAYQRYDVDAPQPQIRVVPGITIPSAPPGYRNLEQPWGFLRTENKYGIAAAEYDVTDWLTAYTKLGVSELTRHEADSLATITGSNGDASVSPSTFRYRLSAITSETGLRARVETGPLAHALTVGFSSYQGWEGRLYVPNGTTILSNIYRPIYVSARSTGALNETAPSSGDSQYTSIFFADTISAFSERVQLTVGGRQQRVSESSFDADGSKSSTLSQSRITPAVGVVLKPIPRLSVFFNYIEALGIGEQAPSTAVNAGQTSAPIQSRQKEVGLKYDFGGWGAALSLFEISQPNNVTDPATNVFSNSGEQRNRGIELEVVGEPLPGVRVVGGAAYTDGVLVRTEGATFNGQTAPGVPRWRGVLSGEWDLPLVKGATLIGRYVHTSPQFYDNANLQSIPSWDTLDIGARYATTLGSSPVIFRALLQNVFDKGYFQSAGRGYVTQGLPRTFQFSTTVRF